VHTGSGGLAMLARPGNIGRRQYLASRAVAAEGVGLVDDDSVRTAVAPV
jgi:hypothetical protein